MMEDTRELGERPVSKDEWTKWCWDYIDDAGLNDDTISEIEVVVSKLIDASYSPYGEDRSKAEDHFVQTVNQMHKDIQSYYVDMEQGDPLDGRTVTVDDLPRHLVVPLIGTDFEDSEQLRAETVLNCWLASKDSVTWQGILGVVRILRGRI